MNFLKNRYGGSPILTRPLVVAQQLLMAVQGIFFLVYFSKFYNDDKGVDWFIFLNILIAITSFFAYFLLKKKRKVGLYFSLSAWLLILSVPIIYLLLSGSFDNYIASLFLYEAIILLFIVSNWKNKSLN